MSDQPASLAEALALLQTRLPRIKKDTQAQYGKYADLADVSRDLLPIMGELGLSFSAKPTWVTRDDGSREFVLAYTLRHVSGESDAGEYALGSSISSQQSLGSAITYGRRYCLCAITGAVADEDDDGSAASPTPGREKPPQRAAGNLPRNSRGQVARSKVTDEELAATGQMTDAQLREHNRLEREVKAPEPGRTERLTTTPDDDPWLEPLPAPKAAGDPAQAIAMQFGRLGITDRDVRLGLTGVLIGRPGLKSSKELTAYEALALKRALERCRNAEAFSDFFDHEADAFRADIAEHRKATP